MNNSDTKQAEQLNETAVNHSVLTLEHLTPYLPYRVKITKEYWGKVFTLDNDGTTLNCVGIDYVLNCKAKPILKPIIDLEKLVYNEFEKFNNNEKHDNRVIDLFCEEKTGFSDELTELENFNDFPYETVVYMFEYHYDVFGLIEKGLAISIHDVK